MSVTNPLAGMTAIVTGAGRGIGRAEALMLASHGAAVVVNDLDEAAAEWVAARVHDQGGRAIPCPGDASRWDECASMVALAIDTYGSLDVVVANAGLVRRRRLDQVTQDDFDLQCGVLLRGPVGLLRHSLEWWRSEHHAGRGRPRAVVTTSSNAGVPGGVEEFGLYGALKAAVAALTVTAAVEARDLDVTVNAICPHAATQMDADAKGVDFGDGDDEDPNGEMSPWHVADLVAWLVSPRARPLTGQVLEVGGGSIRRWCPWSAGPQVVTDGRWSDNELSHAIFGDLYGLMPTGRRVPRATT